MQHFTTLSGSDDDARLGAQSSSGCRFGDAFDLFVHFEHAGDTRAARAAASELLVDKEVEDRAEAISATP